MFFTFYSFNSFLFRLLSGPRSRSRRGGEEEEEKKKKKKKKKKKNCPDWPMNPDWLEFAFARVDLAPEPDDDSFSLNEHNDSFR